VSEEIEGIWIICGDWSEEQLRLLAGNRTTSCAVCNEPVVISTEGLALQAANPLTARAICMDCAVSQNPDMVPDVVPGAIERAERMGYRLSPGTREAMRHKPLKDFDREMFRP
jgi:hypothetical protein